MQNIGLILEGGGMRGLYTCGVLDFFIEKGIKFPSIYGVSAGACHACSYLSKQPGRALKTAMDYIDDKRYASMNSFLKTGDYFGVDFTYNEVPNSLLPFDYDTFSNSESDFYVVVTNCITGKAEYMKTGDLYTDIDIIRASSSLPLLSRFVKLNNTPYLDGGIADPIPVARSIGDGNMKNVVVMTQHRGYKKMPSFLNKAIALRYRKYPELVKSVEMRHIIYNNSLALTEKLENEGITFVIAPKEPVTISRLEKDKTKLMQLYDNGYNDAKESYTNLMDFVAEPSIAT